MAIIWKEEFQNSTGVTALLTDYPTLLTEACLGATAETLWASARTDGGDIQIYLDAACTIRMAIDLVAYDSIAETFEIHTKYSSLGVVLNKLYLAVDDAQVAQPAFSGTYGRNSVWSDYERVFHMGDNVDSSGNGNLTLIGSPSTVAGVVGGGTRFNGTNQRADLGWNSLVRDYTLTVVCNSPNVSTSPQTGPLHGDSPAISWNQNSSPIEPGIGHHTGNWVEPRLGLLAANTNHWISSVYDGANFKGYVGAVEQTSTADTGNLGAKSNFVMASHAAATTRYLEIDIFFASITALPRSADWLATEYNNQSSPSTFWVGQGGALVGGASEITPNSAAHSHTAGISAVSQAYEIAPDSTAHSHGTDAAAISQTHNIAPNAASHAHAANSGGFTQVYFVAPDTATHNHTADSGGVTQAHAITANPAAHAHIADVGGVTLDGDITPDSASHSHTADMGSISIISGIIINPASHSHAADNMTISIISDIIIDTASHAHTADVGNIDAIVDININSASHNHTADTGAVLIDGDITPDSATHSHGADIGAISQIHMLVAAAASHAHSADSGIVILAGVSAPSGRSIIAGQNRTISAFDNHNSISPAAGRIITINNSN